MHILVVFIVAISHQVSTRGREIFMIV